MSVELDELVEDMAAALGAPCVLEDADFRLVGYAAQEGVDEVRRRSILERRSTPEVTAWFHAHGIREATTPVRTPADTRLGISARLCVPARHLNRVHGYFWLIDPDDTITEELWPEAMRIAATAGLLLSRAGRQRLRLEAHLADLLHGDPDSARQAGEELVALARLDPAAPVACVVVHGGEEDLQLCARRGREPAVWIRERPGEWVVLVPAGRLPDSGGGTGAAPRAELLGRLTAAQSVRPALAARMVCGIGPEAVATASPELADSWRAARLALRVARRRGEPQAAWPELGALRLLGHLGPEDLRQAVFSDRAGRFALEGDPALVETAATYLDLAGSVARTADRLALHRQSLYHRLRRIEEATGLRLADGDDRLTLHLALRMAPFVGDGA
ncbi:PucR family transcriptional regulator [Ornithinicoccus halotolerans]|uniref:PucR family transcriptional regulator n=1 Tax=Ornithinicoccus halotolerans TaxID=1748220 RepID=UPI0012950A90|nr:helix-turn-helix domain-containing protein [Ornithinicoccus halotolerans]